jgi:prolyl oligopeptidase
MAGTALTQRPDLWAAVVAQSPVLDLIEAHRHLYARFAVGAQFGDLDDPDEVRRLTTQSLHHLVGDGVRYPSCCRSSCSSPRKRNVERS